MPANRHRVRDIAEQQEDEDLSFSFCNIQNFALNPCMSAWCFYPACGTSLEGS